MATMMPVVAGVDGSEESLRAVEWAALEAQRHGAPLRIVMAPPVPPRMRVRPEGEQAAGRLRGEYCHVLDEAITRAKEVAPGQLIDVDLVSGQPALAVTQSGCGALMLVVGARGSGGFAAMVLGSVSRYAAMHASCPVVVARQETDAVHHEVVVGIRDPLDTGATLDYAFDEARLRGATLIAVHSLNWPGPALGERSGRGETAARPADAAQLAAQAELRLAEALRTWRGKHPGVPVWQDVVHDHPAHVLASYSARADLVVIGRHGGAGSRAAVGGIQHAVLNHARGPVAIVPAAD